MFNQIVIEVFGFPSHWTPTQKKWIQYSQYANDSNSDRTTLLIIWKNNKGKFDGLDFSPWFTCVCCPFRVRCSRDFLLVGMCADCIGLIEKLADYTFGIIRPQRATNLYSLTTILLSGAQTILTELWIRAVGHDKNENVCFNLISNRVANVQAPETPAGGLMWPIAIIICHWARAVGETDRVCSVPRDWAVVWACVCAYFVDCSSCQLVQNWRRDVTFVCVIVSVVAYFCFHIDFVVL